MLIKVLKLEVLSYNDVIAFEDEAKAGDVVHIGRDYKFRDTEIWETNYYVNQNRLTNYTVELKGEQKWDIKFDSIRKPTYSKREYEEREWLKGVHITGHTPEAYHQLIYKIKSAITYMNIINSYLSPMIQSQVPAIICTNAGGIVLGNLHEHHHPLQIAYLAINTFNPSVGYQVKVVPTKTHKVNHHDNNGNMYDVRAKIASDFNNGAGCCCVDYYCKPQIIMKRSDYITCHFSTPDYISRISKEELVDENGNPIKAPVRYRSNVK